MLTFDALREAERKERDAKTLARLPDNFMDELAEYLRRKEQGGDAPDSVARNTIKRLTDARTKKVIDAAFDYSRAGMAPENMTPAEKALFDALAAAIKSHAAAVATELAKPPAVQKPAEKLFRVKKALPEFVGPDMKTYRLSKGDVVALPNPLNELLLKEGVVEEVVD